jgi:SSS family solute:Na+ symporter
MVTLGWLDAAVVSAAAALLLLLGATARIVRPEAFEYVAAGRALSLPRFVASLVVTWYGGILGIAESASYFGVGTWLLLGVPYYVFGTVYALAFAGKVREGAEISIPERLRARFGPASGLVGAVLVVLLAVPAAHALMLGTLLQSVTGMALEPATLVATAVCAVAFVRAGLVADVRAAMLAFPLTYIGFAAMVAVCLSQYPAGATLGPLLEGPLGKLDGGQGPLAVFTFFVLGAWTIVDPGFHQRVASSASGATARRGVLAAVVCWMVFDLLSITAALYAVALVEPPMGNPLLLFPALAEAVLPPGLKGLFLAGVAGTVLSALVGYALVAGSAAGREIMARGRPGPAQVAASRWGVAVACVLAVAIALTVRSVVQLWYSWAGSVVGALLTPFVAAYLGGPALRWPDRLVASAAGAGFLVGCAWMAYGNATGNPTLMVSIGGGPEWGLGTLVPSWIVASAVLGAGLLAGRRKVTHG